MAGKACPKCGKIGCACGDVGEVGKVGKVGKASGKCPKGKAKEKTEAVTEEGE